MCDSAPVTCVLEVLHVCACMDVCVRVCKCVSLCGVADGRKQACEGNRAHSGGMPLFSIGRVLMCVQRAPQYLLWPDHGVPKDFTATLELFKKYRVEREKSQGPVIIHCRCAAPAPAPAPALAAQR